MNIVKGDDKMLKLYKKAEKSKNKIVIPKKFIEKWGNEFYMEIYDNKIVLKPIKKNKEIEVL